MLLLASSQIYSAKSKKTMRKAFFIYNISELTRNRGIRNLGSGWQGEKKKGRCMLVGQSRDIAEEEYLALENELQ